MQGGVAFGSTSGASSVLTFVLGSAIAGLIIGTISLWFLRASFIRLRSVDTLFSNAPAFVLVAMVGLALVAIGAVLLLGGLIPDLSCLSRPTPTSPVCVPPVILFEGLAVILAGGLALLVGGIGVVLAVWRLGDRYNESLFKAGAIVFIFFSPLGAILVLVALLEAERTVRATPTLPPASSFVPPPAPPTTLPRS